MSTCLYTLWATTRARCEVLTDPVRNLTVFVWVGSTLVFQAVVSTSAEARPSQPTCNAFTEPELGRRRLGAQEPTCLAATRLHPVRSAAMTVTDIPGGAIRLPDKPALEGLEAKWTARWEQRRRLPLRSREAEGRGLRHRHAAADRQRLAARRARLLVHAHRHHRALSADARARGVLSDGVGRQRPADRAPRAELLRRAVRSVAAVRPVVRAAGQAAEARRFPCRGRTSSSSASG